MTDVFHAALYLPLSPGPCAPLPPYETQTCGMCDSTLPSGSFKKHANSVSGLVAFCNTCCVQHRALAPAFAVALLEPGAKVCVLFDVVLGWVDVSEMVGGSIRTPTQCV